MFPGLAVLLMFLLALASCRGEREPVPVKGKPGLTAPITREEIEGRWR